MNLRRALTTFFKTAKLILSLPGIAIYFYFKRKRAIGLFKKELMANGMSRSNAEEIAKVFPFKMVDMLKILRL